MAVCGGIGGAKLALGLYRTLPVGELAVVVNTGDDFEHFGFSISPDVDTVLYTLAGLADAVRGWGRAGETWHFMESLREIGGETWFQLGDRDLAMHVQRTLFFRQSGRLSEFVDHVARAYGIAARILPMSDDRMRTLVETDVGPLPFQRYFVERQCAPVVRSIRFEGAESVKPAAGLLDILTSSDLQAIVICPSNPYLSVAPILAVPGVRAALMQAQVPVVAVSPIVGGQAVKGPTAKIMTELGIGVSNVSIAAHYCGLIDGLVIDTADEADAGRLPCPALVTSSVMKDLADRERLAHEVMDFAGRLVADKRTRMARAGS